MLWSNLFIPTLREEPSEGSAGQRRLIRAGYARGEGFLYLGKRSLDKIAAMVRAEMAALGAQEISAGAAFVDAAISIARHDLRSYKQLPQIWFQIDGAEHRACSFDVEPSSRREVYRRILDRCGIVYIAARDEFAVPSADGDQLISRGSQYEWNVKRARSVPRPPAIPDPEGDLSPEQFHTPGQKTIADISAFTGLPETSQMKSLVVVADGAPVLLLLRGDHTLNEHKFPARQATPDEIRRWFGADPGSLGPIGVANMRIVADEALRGRRNMVCGANRNDYHLRHVTPGEDFQAEFLDLRSVAEGDASIVDGTPLSFERAFTLATFEDRDANLHISNEAGKEIALHLSHEEFFLDRVLTAAAAQQADVDGLALAPAIAPFQVIVTPVNVKDAGQKDAATSVHHDLSAAGFDVLLDDRDERPGVKFKDADLIGIPFRVTVGKKLAQGMVEVTERRARQSQDVALDQVATLLSERTFK